MQVTIVIRDQQVTTDLHLDSLIVGLTPSKKQPRGRLLNTLASLSVSQFFDYTLTTLEVGIDIEESIDFTHSVYYNDLVYYRQIAC